MNNDEQIDIAIDSIIQGTISLIPVAGNYVLAALTNAQMSKMNERVNLMVLEMKKLGVKFISKEFINSDEGYDLLMNACQHASRTRSKEKIKRIAQVVAGVVSVPTLAMSDAEIFLDIIGRAAEEELILLISLHRTLKDPNTIFFVKYREANESDQYQYLEIMKELGIPLERNNYIAKRVESFGLINEQDTPASLGGYGYCFTDMGHKLCAFFI